MFTVVNSSQSEHGLGVRDRWSRVGYRDHVSYQAPQVPSVQGCERGEGKALKQV